MNGIGRNQEAGFTLIELMIVVTIMAIIAAIAVPGYRTYVQRAHRTDATAALLRIQNEQEKYYLNKNTYADTLAKLGITGTENGLYTLAISGASATAYTATATATGSQGDDNDCQVFSINAQGVRSATNAGGTNSTAECWR